MSEGAFEYLVFSIGGEDVCVPVLEVSEILQYSPLTWVPNAPPHVRGVLNLRGAVVPVFDLGPRLGTRETLVTRRTCVVLVEVDVAGEACHAGVLADAVHEVIPGAALARLPAPTLCTPAACVRGMVARREGFVPVVDLRRALADDGAGGAGGGHRGEAAT